MRISALIDRVLERVGLVRRTQMSSNQWTSTSYRGANVNRLTMDWATNILSADQEIRSSLRAMRSRCRELANNNDYAKKFLCELQKNVVGATGITLQAKLEPQTDKQVQAANAAIEKAWSKWCRKGHATVCGKMSFIDFKNLWIETLARDGEVFVRRVKNFDNPFGFALQILDCDQIDVQYNRFGRFDGAAWSNEIRMGIEIDRWGRNVAFHVFSGHPSEIGGTRRERVPAEEIYHAYLFTRANQTRGIPFMHTAMSKMNMLGKYEEAEVIAARVSACKMAVITTPDGDSYTGTRETDKKNKQKKGSVDIVAAPGTFEQLADGEALTPIDWQHPNSAFGEFTKSMVRGMAVGLNISYATLSGDLREVNFSSIRQGVLSERDAWKVLQTFAIEHLCQPVFRDWFGMALLTGQLQLPSTPSAQPDFYLDAMNWQGRGWTWVDPLKDVQTAIAGRRAGITSLQDIAAAQGKDWRDTIDQIAAEDAYAEEKGVTLDFGGVKDPVLTDAENKNSDEETGGKSPDAPPDPSRAELALPQGVM